MKNKYWNQKILEKYLYKAKGDSNQKTLNNGNSWKTVDDEKSKISNKNVHGNELN